MESSGRVLLAVLCFSLAVCVLGRPLPSSASPQYSTAQVLGDSSLQAGSNRSLGAPDFGTLETVPWRRSLKRGGGGGGGRRGGAIRGGAIRGGGIRGGAGGLGRLTTTYIILVVVSIAAFVLLVALACWCSSKKRKNPNWRPTDCFKRNKLPREKMFTSAKSDADPDADVEHKVAMDVPRLDHSKSRKLVSPM